MLTTGQDIQSRCEFTYNIALYGELNLVREEMVGAVPWLACSVIALSFWYFIQNVVMSCWGLMLGNIIPLHPKGALFTGGHFLLTEINSYRGMDR